MQALPGSRPSDVGVCCGHLASEVAAGPARSPNLLNGGPLLLQQRKTPRILLSATAHMSIMEHRELQVPRQMCILCTCVHGLLLSPPSVCLQGTFLCSPTQQAACTGPQARLMAVSSYYQELQHTGLVDLAQGTGIINL